MMRRASLLLTLAAVLSACGSNVVHEPLNLGVANNTTIPVTLFVNGMQIKVVEPNTGDPHVPLDQLPDAPWHAELRTSGGRTMLSLDIKEGDVWHTTPDSKGRSERHDAAALAYFSCGRLDLWSGNMLGGPPPEPSFPAGDCDP